MTGALNRNLQASKNVKMHNFKSHPSLSKKTVRIVDVSCLRHIKVSCKSAAYCIALLRVVKAIKNDDVAVCVSVSFGPRPCGFGSQ